jgi:hypothetical protein
MLKQQQIHAYILFENIDWERELVLKNKKKVYFGLFDVQFYFLLRVISIVETILDLFSPSRGGISAVPIAILATERSLMNRFFAISATSTAVVMAWPRAFKVTSFRLPEEKLVMIAKT